MTYLMCSCYLIGCIHAGHVCDVRTSGNTRQRTEGRDSVSELATLQLLQKATYAAGDVVSVHTRVY